MELMMCTGCGTFVHAAPSGTDGAAHEAEDATGIEAAEVTESKGGSDAETLEPLVEECPDCGGTTFKTT